MPGYYRSIAAAVLLVFGTLSPVHASGADQQPNASLELPFPAKAPLVVQIQGVERLRERVLKLLGTLPPAERNEIGEQLEKGWKAAVAGRSFKAISENGRVYVVVHDFTRLTDDVVPISVLIPVTSAAEFRATFLSDAERKTIEKGSRGVDSLRFSMAGREHVLFTVDLKDHVVLTPDKAIAELYVGNYTRARTTTMGSDVSQSFLETDVALYLNMEVVNETHGEDIRDFKALIDFALEQLGMNEVIPGLDKRQLEAATSLIVHVFQAVEDCQALVLAASIRPDGVHARMQVRFREACRTSDLLRTEKPTPLGDFVRLPGRMDSYTAMGFGPRFGQMYRSFSLPFQAGPGDEAGATLIQKGQTELAAAGPGVSYRCERHQGSMQITAYRSPEKALAAEVKLYRGLTAGTRIESVVLKDAPRVAEAASKHRGITFAEIHLVRDFEATVAGLPEPSREAALAILRRSGRERSTLWLGSDGKVVFRLTAHDWVAAEKLLDAYLDGTGAVGSDPGFRTTRQHLPAEATLIALFETQASVKSILDYTRDTLGAFPNDVPPIAQPADVKAEPSYLGVALTLKPQGVTLDLFVPTKSLNVAARMLAPLFKALN